MNRNAIANKIYAELFGGPAPAPAPPPAPTTAPAPSKGPSGFRKVVGFLSRRTNALGVQLKRAQLELALLKNSKANNKSIIDKEAFIEGLRLRIAKPKLIEVPKPKLIEVPKPKLIEVPKPKLNNKIEVLKPNNKGLAGNGRGGQQIIFGGAAPGQAPVAPYPFPMPGPAAAAPYPIQMGGSGAAPQISVKVNTRGPNAGMPLLRGPNAGMPLLRGPNVTGLLPSPSQVNMVKNAGGPMAISAAVTALKRANGNVNMAMKTTGLPRQTFTNVKNLGGVNAAPRIAASVTRHRKRRTTTTKKKPTHKVRKPSIRTNRIKKVIHKVPRKNLERFVLLWALRRKR